MSHSFTAPPKDPSATLDYEMDWSPWLSAGETILPGPQVIAEPTDLAVSFIEVDGAIVRWRASGGALGQSYLITVRIETTAGQVDERTVRVPVVSL